ncbi:DUF3828 domain-containing protein [Xenorhabdus szentirmaii]|uniref:DUF3828 domain-containing protein n=1 Tax=Xenorhabdus szentirmaii TaxID=290112 RepID=A0AAW3YTR3_9GAMM|nr:DUF3828 domain-containing protein [Xenorhabdus sp. M]MBD2801532.1 DUF3828 domain-containing protein [Xenorhabdus sp. M]
MKKYSLWDVSLYLIISLLLIGQANAFAKAEQQSPELVTKEFYTWYMKEYFELSDVSPNDHQNKLKKYVSETLLKKIDEATSCNEPGEFDDCGSKEIQYDENYFIKSQDAYDYWINVNVSTISEAEKISKIKVILGKDGKYPANLLVILEKENEGWKIVSVSRF